MRFFETSAKMDVNVKQSFDTIASLIVGNKTKEQLLEIYGSRNESFNINKSKTPEKSEKKKKECCK